MSHSFRIGSIGCGAGIAARHRKGWAQCDRARISAVCDQDRERAEEVASDCGAACYSDINEMLEEEDLDAVDITTPDFLHAEHAEAVARRGLHVLCTKPLAVSHEGIERVRRAARETGVTVLPAMCNRWRPRYVTARRAIEEGRIGRPVFGQYVYRGTSYAYS